MRKEIAVNDRNEVVPGLFTFICLALCLGFAMACGGGGSGSIDTIGSSGELGRGTVSYGMISGKTRSAASGAILGDVTTRALGQNMTGNERGYFSLRNFTGDSSTLLVVPVSYSKSGYVTAEMITRVRTGENCFLEPYLTSVGATQTFDSSVGVTVSTGGASVTIPADALADSGGNAYSGQATVALTTFDPTTGAYGVRKFPAVFQCELNSSAIENFESLGYIDVIVTDGSGNELQVASGSTITIVIPIASGLDAGAQPASTTVCYYDKSEGKWVENSAALGEATKVGVTYTAAGEHFAKWNVYTAWAQTCTVTGRIINSVTGGTVQGVRVEIEPTAIASMAWASRELSTGDDGTFSLTVPASQSCQLFASKNSSTTSPFTTFTSGAAGATTDVGDISLRVVNLMGILIWEENPRDLDSHISYPTASDREHVYFAHSSSADGTTNLDTDDVTSYGPEIMTVFELNDGDYRYWIHHYSGTGHIGTSGATVDMVVEEVGIYNVTPPEDASGDDDIWKCWEFTVRNSAVSVVSVANQIIHNGSSSWSGTDASW